MRYEKLTHFTEVFTENFVAGEWKKANIPYIQYDHEVLDFINVVNYFEAPHSGQVLNALGYDENQGDLDSINVQSTSAQEILAMLTFVVRTERNKPGTIKKAVEKGTISKWLGHLSALDFVQAS